MKHKIEVLAPVGGQEQLISAVRCGATAVYLGTKNFNARRNGENFDKDSLLSAVKYCHGRGVAVHVALNTLFMDPETTDLVAEIQSIAQCGADAMIIQDLGTARLVHSLYPSMVMHASTQLSIHNVAGASALEELGFSRVVLAREVSKEEIALIKKSTSLEVEIFVHGALCMSMSGSCYLSSLLGERSGNRGLCAQPCRLNFTTKENREYALSLKDLTLVEQIQDLIDIGVDSLKIEGRMKRPEYVAAAVTACNQAIAGEAPDMDTLTAVFSRSGFTSGYFNNERNQGMFGYRRKEDVTAASGVLGMLANTYRGENPLVPVDITVSIGADVPATMEMTDGTFIVSAVGSVPQIALNRPTDYELVKRGAEKLGNTPFYLEKLDATIGDGLMCPVSALNQMRKDCTTQLLAMREVAVPHKLVPPSMSLDGHPKKLSLFEPQLRIRLERVKQLTTGIKKEGSLIILPIWELYSHKEVIAELGEKIVAELPSLIFPAQEKLMLSRLLELKEAGLTNVMAGSLGSVALAKKSGLTIFGDYSLNVLNSHALAAYQELGVSDVTVSFENSIRNTKNLGDYLPYGILGYGYLPVMTFRNCPAKSENGCGDCIGRTTITDRKGNQFPLVCRLKSYTQLLNPIPLYLGDRQETLQGIGHVTLYFTVETPARCDEVTRLWVNKTPLGGQRTGGLYFRSLQ